MGRRVFFAVCLTAIVFEIVHAVPKVMVQWENSKLTEQYMSRMMDVPSSDMNEPSAIGARMGMMMARFSLIAGFAFLGIVMLLKLVYFSVSAIYLARPSTRALFSDG